MSEEQRAQVEEPTAEMREIFGVSFSAAEHFAQMLAEEASCAVWSGRVSFPACGAGTSLTRLPSSPSCRLGEAWPMWAPGQAFPALSSRCCDPTST